MLKPNNTHQKIYAQDMTLAHVAQRKVKFLLALGVVICSLAVYWLIGLVGFDAARVDLYRLVGSLGVAVILIPLFWFVYRQGAAAVGTTLLLTSDAITQEHDKKGITTLRYADIHHVRLSNSKRNPLSLILFAKSQRLPIAYYENAEEIWKTLQPRLSDSAEISDLSNIKTALLATTLPPYLIVFAIVAICMWFGQGLFDVFSLAMVIGFGIWFLFGGMSRVLRPLLWRGRRLFLIAEMLTGLCCLMLAAGYVTTQTTLFALDSTSVCHWRNRSQSGCEYRLTDVDKDFAFADDQTLIYGDFRTIYTQSLGRFRRSVKQEIMRNDAPWWLYAFVPSSNMQHFAGEFDDSITVFDATSKQPIWTRNFENPKLIDFSADSKLLAVQDFRTDEVNELSVETEIWNIESDQLIQTIDGAREIAFSPTETLVVYTTFENALVTYDYAQDVIRHESLITEQQRYETSLTFSEDGTKFALPTYDYITIYDTEDGTIDRIIALEQAQKWNDVQVRFSLDSERLFAALNNNSEGKRGMGFDANWQLYLTSWSLADGTQLPLHLITSGEDAELDTLALSPNGERVAVSIWHEIFVFSTDRLSE